ncbi:DUF5518 domain-containing protein [Halomicroarcula sp. GCM10025324]|jgi:hypothetical protein|uniref:DUF5518 domain-containing protein n=1 Tax=Haloarcula TaxID=2237 RepID=UPI0023E777DD|nr:DUF5518 domain-containing protein [Halomicroarcula sp. ZS-22-S1]
MSEGDSTLNAVIGAVATALLSGFVPFAPVFGGALAGYLEGGDRNDGLRVGVVSGLIGAAIAAVLFIAGFLVFAVFLGTAGAPWMFGTFGLVIFIVGGILGGVYIVGLSALGGWIGNYVKNDTSIGS